MSFGVVQDKLGFVRTEFPHTVYGVAGTQVWDFTSNLNTLAESETKFSGIGNSTQRISPLMKFSGHKDEGYALDWSPIVTGRLVSGDCNKCIYLWEPSSKSWNVELNPFVGHTASVEDLQWSPMHADVFASCSVDVTIAIWDTRSGKSPTGFVRAHDSDVNVISWKRWEEYMIASGSDDGTFAIHDIRVIKKSLFSPGYPEQYSLKNAVFSHGYHKSPITSIEWSPHEASTFTLTSEDHQLTIWDISLERDEEEEAEIKSNMKEQANTPEDLPSQLLFVHQGQKNLKELHWHPQIPGMLIATAEDGFNVLMPANV